MRVVSTREASRKLPSLIESVIDDRSTVEMVSDAGNAVLMPADEFA